MKAQSMYTVSVVVMVDAVVVLPDCVDTTSGPLQPEGVYGARSGSVG